MPFRWEAGIRNGIPVRGIQAGNSPEKSKIDSGENATKFSEDALYSAVPPSSIPVVGRGGRPGYHSRQRSGSRLEYYRIHRNLSNPSNLIAILPA